MSNHEKLKKILIKHNLNEGDKEHVRNQRKSVENFLTKEYGDNIHNIVYSGSYGKHTAVKPNYDIDLCVHFKKASFETLKEMYNDVYQKLSSTTYVFQQNSSLRIDRGQGLSIDVVPARIINNNEPERANLYRRDNGESITTNIKAQKDYVSESNARPIIKLMKIWRDCQNLKFKSFGLELLTIKAMESYKGKDDYGDKLYHVLSYTKSNVETAYLLDPGNSNNVVSRDISLTDKLNMKLRASNTIIKDNWINDLW